MDSPPKRMTRSRAAAKATEPAIASTKIVTAAARAKSTATASTKSTAAKRKTRADEDDEQLHKEVPATKRAARGRPRKAAEPEESSSTAAPTVTARTARGRPPKKASATEVPKEDPAPAPKPARGRPRKAAEPQAEEAAPEPAARSARTRGATSTTISMPAKSSTKTATKKSVKFQEPDKENIEPTVKKAPVVTSIRGRPAKRGPVAAPRRAQGAEKEKKPLSPKKVTQLSMMVRDEESEDELAGGDFVPVPLMKKNPIKAPSVAPKQAELSLAEPDADSTMQVNFDILNPPALTTGLASPARRPPTTPTPFKDLMRSPARKIAAISFPGSTLKSASKPTGTSCQTSSLKGSLLQSPAKRPPSPIKGFQPASTSTFDFNIPTSPTKVSLLQSPAKRAIPGFKPLLNLPQREQLNGLGSPAAKSQTPSAPLSAQRPSAKLMMDEELLNDGDDDLDEIDTIKFPGRLSAVLPREADPSMLEADEDVDGQDQEATDANDGVPEEAQAEPCEAEDEQAEPGEETENENEDEADEQGPIVSSPQASPKVHDSICVSIPGEEEESSSSAPSTPSASPVEAQNPMYQLRPKDLCDGTDSESEDESTIHLQATPTTSSLFASKSSRRSTLGFTSLAEQFGAWSATSPTKPTPRAETRDESPSLGSGDVSPAVENFFEDEMHVHPGGEGQPAVPSISMENGTGEEAFDDVMILDEDIELAQEADEMSLMEPEQLPKPEAQSFDDSLSDASQEYGDENQMPIDPAIAATTTPVRPLMKTFNTTTKVPLKPADDSTPSPVKKRSLSASRVTLKRPSAGLGRNATVISYSPTKNRRSSRAADRSAMPETPSKSDIWSTMGTPVRTPRKDVDPALLRGAVVHVDVHTSEGADASGIFVELLTQMGARCVKTWHWNPNSLSGEDASSSKIGITHVVFKDGGKRTLEKVRQTDGVVQCVGVSWVLDCERENEWLDESPYYIDTSLVPRGGARRRKSMEPRALANKNGTLVGNGSKSTSSSRESMGPPETPMNRRQSTAWMHSPSEGLEGQEDEEDDIEWSKFILTPVPKTPAPEAVARYADEIPGTPGADDTEEFEMSPTREELLTRTCPPKKSALFQDLGRGILSKDKDEQVLLRLMAARRKSLQFAPKVGSPLSKAWA
ncbi:unnamed protein product [Clonostachys rhizophaga]|uniref:BRCT domain-containing protein n=1 Tax=Clonostachys rhizophaga TaxID=160324 RepID=A0A9N9W159_9HYPO|nr:unnamed protein product [Clonostachys rhizophaga]